MRIVIPVKPLENAKTRLDAVLSLTERAGLMRCLFGHVLREALEVAPVSVVTPDPTIAALAGAAGADVIWETGAHGLNAAAQMAAHRLRGASEQRIMLLAADLPQVTAAGLRTAIDRTSDNRMLIICPSRDGTGTNALILATGARFEFAYGPGSCARHHANAARIGLSAIEHHAPEMADDLDWPDDLARYRMQHAA